MAELKQHPGRTNDDHKFKRNTRFEIKLSEIEYEALIEKWHQSGQHNSMARFARACIFGEEDIVEIHFNNTKQTNLDRLQVAGALGKIGSNFNQIAKQLNSKYDFITAKTLIAELEKIRTELEKISNLNEGE